MTLVEHLNVTLLDRCGDRLFCGGDDLFSFVACDEGLSFGIFPALRITHLISSGRLNERYMLRLIHDHAYSHTVLNQRLSGELPHLRYGVDKIRAVLHGVRHGSFSMKARLAELRGVQAAMAIIGDRPGQPLAGKVHENKQTSVAIPIAK